MTTDVRATEYAELRGKPKAFVSRLIAVGMPHRRVGREIWIRPAVAIDWEVKRAVDEANRDRLSQRERLAKEQADRFALENARRRGELVIAADVEDVILAMSADLAKRLDSLGGRMAGELSGMSDAGAIRIRLFDEHREVRRAFAEAIGKLADARNAPRDDEDDKPPKPKRRKKRESRS